MTGNCCESESKCGCGDMKAGCGCKCHSCECCGGEMSKDKMMFMMFMEMADASWMKMTKEKMKAVWEKKIGHDMEKSAEFFVEQSMMKWMNEEEWMKNMPKAMEIFSKMMAEKKAKKLAAMK
ncbi:hypothetical protein HZC07_06290 [Candidatus Micrarchaeota archaeon]|nr:hypothetical protein [Candidatus Micrarchaeota archaeon]